MFKSQIDFLEALIDENILIKNTGYKGEMIIYFSYERMGDYFLSEYLLEKYRNVDKRDLVTKLQSDEKVTRYQKGRQLFLIKYILINYYN